jgi:hypothetical protein
MSDALATIQSKGQSKPPTAPKPTAPKVDAPSPAATATSLWQALKLICCADPAKAKRAVMVDESDLDRAVKLLSPNRQLVVTLEHCTRIDLPDGSVVEDTTLLHVASSLERAIEEAKRNPGPTERGLPWYWKICEEEVDGPHCKCLGRFDADGKRLGPIEVSLVDEPSAGPKP